MGRNPLSQETFLVEMKLGLNLVTSLSKLNSVRVTSLRKVSTVNQLFLVRRISGSPRRGAVRNKRKIRKMECKKEMLG